MKKRILSLLLTAALILGLMPASVWGMDQLPGEDMNQELQMQSSDAEVETPEAAVNEVALKSETETVPETVLETSAAAAAPETSAPETKAPEAETPADQEEKQPLYDAAEPLSMNNYSIEWVSGSSVTKIENNHLSIDPSSNSEATVTARITFSASGQEGIPKEGAEMRIPYHIFQNWDGGASGNFSIGIPQKPQTGGSTSFYYYIDEKDPEDPLDDEIVITNYEEIKPGGFFFRANVIWSFMPMEVDSSASNDQISAAFKIVTADNGNVLEEEAENLAVSVNTKVIPGNAYKKGLEKKESWQEKWGPKPEDADDYFYVEWLLRYDPSYISSNTMAYSVTFAEDEPVGELVAWSNNFAASDSTTSVPGNLTYTLKTDGNALDEAPCVTYNNRGDIQKVGKIAVMRYPKNEIPAQGDYEIENSFTLTVTPKHGAAVQKVALNTYTYQRVGTDDPYPGGMFDMYKRGHYGYGESSGRTYSTYKAAINMLRNGSSVGASWSLGVKNYSGFLNREYDTILRDGMMYINGQRLQPGDYELTEFALRGYVLYDLAVDPNTGLVVEPDATYTEYEPIKVMIRSKHTSDPADPSASDAWEEYGQLNRISATTIRWTPVNGAEASLDLGAKIALPEGTYDIKLVHTGTHYGVSYQEDLFYRLNPTDHMMNVLIKDLDRFDLYNINEAWGEAVLPGDTEKTIYTPHNTMNQSTTAGIKADVETSDIAEYGSADKVMHDYSYHTFTADLGSGSLSKSMSKEINDINNARVTIPVTLTWDYYINFSNLGITKEEAYAAQVIKESREGVFYDLLPKGVTVDLASIQARIYAAGYNMDNVKVPPCDYTVEMVENWRGTGQTMMILHVTVPEGYRNFDNSSTYLNTGFKVSFNMIDTWENIEENGTNLKNLASFHAQEGSVPGGISDSAAPPSGYNGFGNMNGGDGFDDSVKNVKYAQASRNMIVTPAAQMGFRKTVKSAADPYYSEKTTVPATGTYTYQMRFKLEPNATAKGVVLYDVLEAAYAQDQAHWQGTFTGLDISQIQTTYVDKVAEEGKKLAPVVYYSTSRAFGKLDAAGGIDYTDLTNTDLWTTEVPDPLSSVTAVAIDLRKNRDGSDHVFQSEEFAAAYIKMQAPAEYKPLLDKQDTAEYDPAYAYNKSYIKQQGQRVQESSTVKVEVTEPKVELEKTSDPASGTAEIPIVVDPGDVVTYTLSATNRNLGETITDVKIEDEIPADMEVNASEIRYYIGSQKSAAAPADGTGRAAAAVTGNKVSVVVNKLASNETIHILVPAHVSAAAATGSTFENTAKLTAFNGAEWDFTSNTTYHESEEETVHLKIRKDWDDLNNYYGKRPASIQVEILADGVLLPDETVTLTAAKNWKAEVTHLPKYRRTTGRAVAEIQYTIREKGTIPGYEVTDSVDAETGEMVLTNKMQVSLRNQAISLKLKKLRTGTEIPLEDVVFELLEGNRVIGVYTTDAEGNAVIDAVPNGTAAYTVKLKEQQTKPGYDLPADAEWNVTLTPGALVDTGEYSDNNESIYKQYWDVSITDPDYNAQNQTLIVYNNYNPTPVDVTLPVKKLIAGDERPEAYQKDFVFTIDADGAAPLPADRTVTIRDEGQASFELHYTLPGEYHYIIAETQKTTTGYQYDEAHYNVTVTVTDVRGVLNASWTAVRSDAPDAAADTLSFTNQYHPLAAEVKLAAIKVITGHARPAETEFHFTLTSVSENQGTGSADGTTGNGEGETDPDDFGIDLASLLDEEETCDRYRSLKLDFDIDDLIPDNGDDGDNSGDAVQALEAAVTGEGEASFETLKFEKTGTYRYIMKEVNDGVHGYTYDETEHEVIVTVTDEDGVLTASCTVDGETGTKAVFTNAYKPDETVFALPVEKKLTGDTPEETEEFTFILEGRDQAPMPQTDRIVISGAGTGAFEEISFDTAGTYRYVVREQAGSAEGYTYDDHVYAVTVEVTDTDGVLAASWMADDAQVQALVFENTYTKKEGPADKPDEETKEPKESETSKEKSEEESSAPQESRSAAPLNNGKGGGIFTGENSQLYLWMILLIAAGLGMGTAIVYRRKKK